MHSNYIAYKLYRHHLFALLLTIFLCQVMLVSSEAQITLDGSLGLSGPLSGPDYIISDDMGRQLGSNLFHSFGLFNIQKGESATFEGPASIENIIGRVTGGSPSVIDGLLQSNISGASLFLLNPNGVLFGPNAQLNVSASFHISTANVLRFSDGNTFSANLSEESGLTGAAPVAFGFLNRNPAGIDIQGSQITVQEGETLSVTAGDISITSGGEGSPQSPFLGAPSGQIYLTSVADSGEVRVAMVNDVSRLAENRPARLGSVSISDAALIDVSGGSSGTILMELDTFTLSAGAQIRSVTFGSGSGGEIRIMAEDTVTIDGSTIEITPEGEQVFIPSQISTTTVPGSIGEAATIRVDAQQLRITNNAAIVSSISGDGRSGDVVITADDLTLGTGAGIATLTELGSAGRAGDILVEVPSVTIQNGAFILSVTQGSGQAGNVTVSASNLVLDGSFGNPSEISTTSAPGSTGDSGDILINAHSISITNGAQIQSRTLGTGQGGDITVNTDGAVNIDGFGVSITPDGEERPIPSGIATSSQEITSGNAGDILIHAQSVSVTKGGQIQSGTAGTGQGGDLTVMANDSVTVEGFGGGFLSLITASALPNAEGGAGNVRVEAQTVNASNGGQISSATFGAGRGGSVTIEARDSVTFSGTSPEGEEFLGVLIPGDNTFPSGALVSSLGSGAPGVVQVSAPKVTLSEGGQINSVNVESEAGGGIVIVNAPDTLEISGVGSGLRTRSFGPGQGGDIEVRAGTMILTEGADLSAASIRIEDAESSGDAGNVAVIVSDQIAIDNSTITTEAPDADGGDIQLTVENGVVRLIDSRISAEINQDSGKGGNVTIDADAIILDRSQVLTRAGPGTGGDIAINGAFVFDGTYVSGQACSGNPAISCLDASGQVSGNIDEGSPVDTSGITSPLPQRFAQATKLLQQRCAERLQGGRSSSLVLTGRAGVPVELGGALPSTMLQEQVPGSDAVDNTSGQNRIDHLAKLAQTQEAAGLYDQAIATLHTMKKRAEETGDKTQLAVSLGHLGNAYIATGQDEKAEHYLKQGVEKAKALGQTALVARILNNRGNLLEFQQYDAHAQVVYAQSLQFALEAKDLALAARVLTNTALVAIQTAQYAEAQALLDQAWMHIDPLKPTLAIAHTLVSMGVGYSRLHAYLLDSQTDVVQRATSALTEAGVIANGHNDWRTASYAWGYLGRLYLEQGQYPKALQWTRQATLAAQRVNAPESLYRWQWQTGRLFKKLGQMNDAIAAYQRAVATLESFRHELLVTYARTEGLHQTIGPVYFELVDLILKRSAVTQDAAQRQKALLAARDTVELFKVSELQDYFQDECIQAFQAKKQSLEEWTSSDVAIIYPILLPDRLELLVSVSSGLERFSVPVDAETLTQEVLIFRRLLENPTTHDYRRHARQLYDWLIRPLEPILIPSITTLVFVPDGALRSIPFAPLHDGEHFLIEQYAVAATLGLDLIEPRTLPKNEIRGHVLAAGLTEGVQNFSPLPYVRDELNFLQTEYGSKTLLNEMFRATVVNQTIEQASYTIVHLATHAQFAGDVDNTFLLTYDDKLDMNELREMIAQAQFRDEPIELLTLSACETAVGDDRAVLGLAGVALRAGARSALATLWLIDDQASSQLISEFYRQLNAPEVSRAGALRQAQLKLLQDRDYHHPFFWAAFQMLNTWL